MAVNTSTLAAAIVEANKDKQGYFLQFENGDYVGALKWRVKSKRAAMVTCDPSLAKKYSDKRSGKITAVKKRKYTKRSA